MILIYKQLAQLSVTKVVAFSLLIELLRERDIHTHTHTSESRHFLSHSKYFLGVSTGRRIWMDRVLQFLIYVSKG